MVFCFTNYHPAKYQARQIRFDCYNGFPNTYTFNQLKEMTMTITPLVKQVANHIADYINSLDNPAEAILSERPLATRLRVSRGPIRKALKLLQEQGIIEPGAKGGFVAKKAPKKISSAFSSDPLPASENLYQQIASARLSGELSGRVSENELLRRYHVSRSLLTRVLQTIEVDGWIESLPGHGWFFPAMETSIKDYLDGYRFRAVIEPAAILDSAFKIDREALKRCRTEHQQLLAGGIEQATPSDIFQINKRLHETIISGSNNSFFISSLKRVNGLRRLLEHNHKTDPDVALTATREHLAIIDLLLANKRSEAAAALGRHLRDISERRSQQQIIVKRAKS